MDKNRAEWLEDQYQEYKKIAGAIVRAIESGDVAPTDRTARLEKLLVEAGWMDEDVLTVP